MPTVLRQGPYRFFFYSGDGAEPPHVHVERDASSAKIWLDPVRLQNSVGFGGTEINRIIRLAGENRDTILQIWESYFYDGTTSGKS